MKRRFLKGLKQLAYRVVQLDGINIGLYLIIFSVLIWKKIVDCQVKLTHFYV